MKFGTQLTHDGVRFRLWAPLVPSVHLDLDNRLIPMNRDVRGWHEVELEGAGPGTLYRFRLPDGTSVPDPASRFQPQDVDGPSEVIDPLAFEWTDLGWRGRPWEESVFYELHVGTFTPEGTFLAAADRLEELADLGITAIELMPIADFQGRWNWGYDGALLFAPDASYGRPEHLKALINKAHSLNLTVYLDVVYNHFGPKGNYIPLYAPVLNDEKATPWGPGLNVDGENAIIARDLILANARYWVNEYRFDGLRFDAVHMIEDTGPRHLVQDLAEQTRAATDGRHVHLVTENSYNQAGWLKRRDDGTPWLYTAQWNDDLHHVLHAVTTGETFWYYEPFAGQTELIGRALAEGFAYQGELLERENRIHGEPSAFLPATAFVSFIQNHDHIGNRPGGERIASLLPPEAVRVLAALYLLAPQVPLIFMGEEWGSKQPFYFFSDIRDLGQVISESRREELHLFPETMAAGPDPMEEATFIRSKLDRSEMETADGHAMRSLYKSLIKLRRDIIAPKLVGMPGHSGSYRLLGGQALEVHWNLGDGGRLHLVANLGSKPVLDHGCPAISPIWTEGEVSPMHLGPWSLAYWLSDPP